jgi:hypothetical protein
LVWVSVQWRDAEQIPTLLSILSDIPPAPNDHDLEVMRRNDGRALSTPPTNGLTLTLVAVR